MTRVQLASVLIALLAVSGVNGTPTKLNKGMPEHASLINDEDALQLGRLARLINFAQCPSDRHLQPNSGHISLGAKKGSGYNFKPSSWSQPKDALELGYFPAATKQWGPSGLEFGSDVVYTSKEVMAKPKKGKSGKKSHAGYVITNESNDIDWLVSHNPRTNSLTLAMSSLPTAESFLALLEEEPFAASGKHHKSHKGKDNHMMVELPAVLFPKHLMDQYPAFVKGEKPMMHSALLEPLLKHGPAVLLRLLELIESPPQSGAAVANMRASGGKLSNGVERQANADEISTAIEKITISGHGLGADLTALIALSLQVHLSDPARAAKAPAVVNSAEKSSKVNSWISGKGKKASKHSSHHTCEAIEVDAVLFGMSRIGNAPFADWVDALIEGTATGTEKRSHVIPHQPISILKVARVSSYADVVPHMPPTELGFQHFASGEMWVDGDPRTVWQCSNFSEGGENTECANSVPLDHTSLLDHAGPYFDVWVGGEMC